MEPRTLTVTERALFRLTHDMSERDGYAAELIALVYRIPRGEAQTLWDESSVGEAHQIISTAENALNGESVQEHIDALVADPELSAIMRVCEHYQISFTQFSEWTALDQDLALAFFIESRDTCPGCGLAKRLRKQYVKLGSEQCVHCQQLAEAKKKIPDELRDHTHLTVHPE